MPSLIPVTTVRLGEHLPLLDLLPKGENFSWVRGGDGVVGWGVYASTTVKGANRFNDARTWWHSQLEKFAITNNVQGSATGPILFSSFSFSPDEESVLVIPEVILGMSSGISWITWIGSDSQPLLIDTPEKVSNSTLTWNEDELGSEHWITRVAQAIAKIHSGEIEKVVLARDLSATAAQAIDERPALRNLSSAYPSTWVFSVAGLIGATPELLIRLKRGMVTSRVLAGTISKSGDDARDLALAGSLARSSKDLEEHEYAVRSVADALEPFCSSTNIPETPFVLHLANVMHLATDVTGALIESKSNVDIFTLLNQLHPSAAVCGTPTDKAAKVISEIESMSRGRYAGPVGWIDARGDGELGIALRCGQISENTIRIYAGCGIVAGSDPEKELAESEAKFSAMKSALA
jgi:menaquinone-specific isochorismate synthase